VQTSGSSITQVHLVLLALKQPNLEEVFGSASRLRSFQSTVEAGEISITSLSRKTNLNHTSLSRQGEALKELGLIGKERYARIRMHHFLLWKHGVRKSEHPILYKKFTNWFYLNTDTEPASTEELYENSI